MRLKERVALVTGGGQGIGRGIVQRFAAEGAAVAINYVGSPDRAQETLAAVQSASGQAIVVEADVSNVAQVYAMVDRVVERFGHLDVLVNNAGIETHAPFWEVAEADFDRVIAVNLKGTFFATQAVVNHLRKAGKPGKIVNISSVHEDLPFPNFAAYCASKGGIRMLTRDLAVELAPLNITINAIAPGAIETPINRALLNDPKKLSDLLDHIPLRRLGKPEDVAGLAAFLASSDADYVTGATYLIDGGLTFNYHEQ